MRRSRKFILIGLMGVIVLAGSIGGAVYAQTGDENADQPQAKYQALLDKVATIYQQNTGTTIDPQELDKAFTQARSEMQSAALDNYLQSLVDQGKLTQDQADQYQTWLQAKPDVPLPLGPRAGMHRGFGMFRGFGPKTAPSTTDNG